jgi:hypothetical protein
MKPRKKLTAEQLRKRRELAAMRFLLSLLKKDFEAFVLDVRKRRTMWTYLEDFERTFFFGVGKEKA